MSDQAYPTSEKFQPYRDELGNKAERENDYVARMQAGPLPNWPEEPLREWLHWHFGQFMEHYAFLDFETFRFEEATWPLEQFPGREAFRDRMFFDCSQNLEERAASDQFDWVARFMMREGTSSTPIILLDNRPAPGFLHEPTLNVPYHLLEGHCRLSYLHALKQLGKARPEHSVWVVRRPDVSTAPTGLPRQQVK